MAAAFSFSMSSFFLLVSAGACRSEVASSLKRYYSPSACTFEDLCACFVNAGTSVPCSTCVRITCAPRSHAGYYSTYPPQFCIAIVFNTVDIRSCTSSCNFAKPNVPPLQSQFLPAAAAESRIYG